MVSVSCFGVRVSVMFHYMFVHYTCSSVWVAELSPFGEIAARSVSDLFSLYFVYLLYLFISRFGFKSGICLLIVWFLFFAFLLPLHPFGTTGELGFLCITLLIDSLVWFNITKPE